MATNLYRKVGEMDFDGLLTDLYPAVNIRGGIIRKAAVAATLVRGTVLAKSSVDNKLVVLGSTAATGSQKFSGDGSITAFTVTAKPDRITSVKVSTTDITAFSYDASTGVLTCGSAPASGTENVVVAYPGEVLVPDCILCDDLDLGTTEDAKEAVYISGCFDPDKVTVASGYIITEADKDKLRERSIVFKAASDAN